MEDITMAYNKKLSNEKKSKKFMVHMSDRLFYMVRMPEAISDPTQI